MPYGTVASILPGARKARLALLVERLGACGCVVRLECRTRLLVVELPEDDYQWIVTGGLARLLLAFGDCLSWQPHFHERPRGYRPRLPPPCRDEAP